VILEEMPLRLVAGDTLILRVAPSEFPVADWVMSLKLVGSTNVELDVTEESAPVGYRATLTAEDSADLAAGFYSWAIRFAGGADEEVVTWKSGTLEVLGDPETATPPTDPRTFARKQLEAVEAAIAKKGATTSFTLFGRAYSFESYEAMMDFRDRLKREIAREDEKARRAAGKPSRRTGWFRFRLD
jgi:hypothetical protein